MTAPPFWAPPSHLPDDLPDHEVWQQTMPFHVWGTPAPHPPQTAPGFERAWRLGLCPPHAPEAAPTLLPGWSSLHYLVAIIGSGVASALVMAAFAERVDGVATFAFPVMGLGVFCLWLRWIKALKVRGEAEADAGYTVFAAQQGLWALNPFTGRVRREPDRRVLPSGFYPSPYFPGVLQAWDGPDWAPLGRRWHRPASIDAVFRRPPIDFLGVGNVELDAATSPGAGDDR